jgi:hypothetical protein
MVDPFRTVAVVRVRGEERGVLHGACDIAGERGVLRVVLAIRSGRVRVVTAMRGRGAQVRPYLARREALEAQLTRDAKEGDGDAED